MQAAFPITRPGRRDHQFLLRGRGLGQWYHGDCNATNATIRALTISSAADWGRHNVMCSAISPTAAGTVYSLLEKVPNLEAMVRSHPLGRTGDPATDIAPVARFFATDDSRYVNGQLLIVNGGGAVPGCRLP
jgi:3-oxoacyl-[acyl-carrier protein] reductase